MKEINEVQVLLDAGATIATEEDLSRVTATDRKVLPFQSYTTKADWLRSEIEKLEGEMVAKGNYNCGEEGCCNPNPKDEREKEDIEWQIGYNKALTSIITRYKEELKVLESNKGMKVNKIPKYEIGSRVRAYSANLGVTFIASVIKIKKNLFGGYKYLLEWDEQSHRFIKNETDRLAAWWSEKNIID